MSIPKRLYPFNAEQTVNIASEFGPLVTMFVVNAMYGINTGTWALILTTVMAIGAMLYMFGRPPVFPLIASTVTIVFGALTLITKDPMWVQIKVTIFNAMFAGFLFGGLWRYRDRNQAVAEFGPVAAMFLVGLAAGSSVAAWVLIGATLFARAAIGRGLSDLPWVAFAMTLAFAALALMDGDPRWLKTNVTSCAALSAGFAMGALFLNRNFFAYVFETTFHYTKDGWDAFTRSFAWFFTLTAVMNEVVRLTFKDDAVYDVLGHEMNGVNIWIAFKLLFIMPLSGFYAWLLTKWMSKHRIPAHQAAASRDPAGAPQTDAGLAPAVTEARASTDIE